MAQPEITVDQITPQPAFDGVNISGVDSDLLSGQIGSFYQDASNLNAGTISSGRLTGTYTINISGSASQLNNQSGSFYQDASNLNAGTINDARLPATISSDITGNSATSTTASDSNALGGSAAANWAKLASPIFTGNPRAPTVGSSDNDTTIATTAFVQSVVGSSGVISMGDRTYSSSQQADWNNTTGGVVPKFISIFMVNTIADGGYVPGDIISINHTLSESDSGGGPQNQGIAVQVSTTNVRVRVANNRAFSLSTGKANFQPNYGRWIFRAYAIT